MEDTRRHHNWAHKKVHRLMCSITLRLLDKEVRHKHRRPETVLVMVTVAWAERVLVLVLVQVLGRGSALDQGLGQTHL